MSHEMQALESRVALLEEALSEDVREKLQALVGGGLLDEEMKKLVRELAEDIDNYKPPNIHKQHELLEVLLKGARPAELSNPEILVDVMVQIAVGSGSNDKLREKYMDVLRRAPCSPLANKHMIAVIDESDAVMQARRMGLNRLLRMVLLSVVDTLTDVYVLYVYWETKQYYFFAFSCAGILGCIFFTSEALWELGKAQELSTPCRVVSIVLNIASLATYSIAVIGQEVKTKPTEEGWDLHIRAKRGEAFEAGFALLPNVYSIFIAGVVKGYSSSKLRLWLQVGSSFFSIASMALTSHLNDAHASLVQSRTNSVA